MSRAEKVVGAFLGLVVAVGGVAAVLVVAALVTPWEAAPGWCEDALIYGTGAGWIKESLRTRRLEREMKRLAGRHVLLLAEKAALKAVVKLQGRRSS